MNDLKAQEGPWAAGFGDTGDLGGTVCKLLQNTLIPKGSLLHCGWECKLIQPLWRTVWRFLKILKIELPYDPAIPLLGIYPEKTIIQKESCTTMFIAALFTIAKTWKQPKCPLTDDWIKNLWHIYTMEYYSAIKIHVIELPIYKCKIASGKQLHSTGRLARCFVTT